MKRNLHKQGPTTSVNMKTFSNQVRRWQILYQAVGRNWRLLVLRRRSHDENTEQLMVSMVQMEEGDAVSQQDLHRMMVQTTHAPAVPCSFLVARYLWSLSRLHETRNWSPETLLYD